LQKIFSALREKGALRGFGSYVGALSLSRTLGAADVERVTGLPQTAFQGEKGFSSGLRDGAGIFVTLFLFYTPGLLLGLDPTLIAFGIIFFLLADRVLLGYKYGDTLKSILNPQSKEVESQRTAGQFLTAYLLGLPLSYSYRDIAKEAISWDAEFQKGVASKMLSREAIERQSIVTASVLAGQAYGGGGVKDSKILGSRELMQAQLDDGRSFDEVNAQSRWGLCQSFLMMKEYDAAFKAVYDAIQRGVKTQLDDVNARLAEIDAELSGAPAPSKSISKEQEIEDIEKKLAELNQRLEETKKKE
jgi:hypothetical protein